MLFFPLKCFSNRGALSSLQCSKIYHINSSRWDPLAEAGFKRAGFQTACQGKVGGGAPQESSRALIYWKAADTRRGGRWENPRAHVYLLNPSCQQPRGHSAHSRRTNRLSLRLLNPCLKQIGVEQRPPSKMEDVLFGCISATYPIKPRLGLGGAAYPGR